MGRENAERRPSRYRTWDASPSGRKAHGCASGRHSLIPHRRLLCQTAERGRAHHPGGRGRPPLHKLPPLRCCKGPQRSGKGGGKGAGLLLGSAVTHPPPPRPALGDSQSPCFDLHTAPGCFWAGSGGCTYPFPSRCEVFPTAAEPFPRTGNRRRAQT